MIFKGVSDFKDEFYVEEFTPSNLTLHCNIFSGKKTLPEVQQIDSCNLE